MSFKRDVKKYFNKFWFLVWKDESLKGWIFSVIFIFILIKFIFFPLLSFTTGTNLPLAIVESCSMYHSGNLLSNFNNWFQKHDDKYSIFNVTKENFQNFHFKNGLNKGDILFVIGTNPNDLRVGDVVIFNAGQNNPIIHRIIKITEENGQKTFSTMGDNNNGQLFFENGIKPNQIVGKPVWKVGPYIGWIKLIFFENSRFPNEKGFCKEN